MSGRSNSKRDLSWQAGEYPDPAFVRHRPGRQDNAFMVPAGDRGTWDQKISDRRYHIAGWKKLCRGEGKTVCLQDQAGGEEQNAGNAV